MKKGTLIFGSLLAVFLMLMIPNISAMNAQAMRTAVEEKINTYKNSVTNTKTKSANSLFSLHFMKELIKTKGDNQQNTFI